ncbi:MAG: hypothetical protein KatS3mg111_4264 [Pirellulaceae bacterium]|nr:MAG: hypothetical protein KatS3mg111_4264 [Pirellulaceae bacterium]
MASYTCAADPLSLEKHRKQEGIGITSMNIQQFLQHHGIQRNPFVDEDAQTDTVFKEGCIDETFHPAWDKVYGDPREPATAIVFGCKGSGKTAMLLQIARHLSKFNREHPDERIFTITYNDFNPFLDRFRMSQHFHRGDPLKLLQRWRLSDHMDAILSLGVTKLIDAIVGHGAPEETVAADRLRDLPPHTVRDLLLLQTCYDQSSAEPVLNRWHMLRKKLRYAHWRAYLPMAVGVVGSLGVLTAAIAAVSQGNGRWVSTYWYVWLGALMAVWGWWLQRFVLWTWRASRIRKHTRSLTLETNMLRHRLLRFSPRDLMNQPLPNKSSCEDRYELLAKLQAVLAELAFRGVIVLVDRVDEPELINGDPQRIKALVWPLLDNKFLKHPGLGVKMMLPEELKRFVDREDAAFYERARLDKQNMISSFEWTPEALLDVANARIACCADGDRSVTLFSLLSEDIRPERVKDALRELRVPRHLFKFCYRLLVAHCNAHTQTDPVWHVQLSTFESELAVYLRDLHRFEQGLGAG